MRGERRDVRDVRRSHRDNIAVSRPVRLTLDLSCVSSVTCEGQTLPSLILDIVRVISHTGPGALTVRESEELHFNIRIFLSHNNIYFL